MVNETTEATIIDMLGNTIYHSTFTTQHNTINVVGLSDGIYNLSIATTAGVVNKRVVIVK
jgi:hypothetical protein